MDTFSPGMGTWKGFAPAPASHFSFLQSICSAAGPATPASPQHVNARGSSSSTPTGEETLVSLLRRVTEGHSMKWCSANQPLETGGGGASWAQNKDPGLPRLFAAFLLLFSQRWIVSVSEFSADCVISRCLPSCLMLLLRGNRAV